MASVHDVAAYIIHQKGRLTTIKLQKLLYYCQAWSLVWDDRPLFSARIEAWANGPVVPMVFRLHRGDYSVTAWTWGSRSNLKERERQTINAVLRVYGNKTSQWLVELTHREKPWRDARNGLGPLDVGYH